MLFEYFDQELNQLHDQVKHLYDLMINLENKIISDLSLSRNNLIRMDIVISLINSGFGIGTLITGVFGMNLKNTSGEARICISLRYQPCDCIMV
ncbi:hypothetical protein PFDG_02428 [Plasmodium falciparum Dd2]|uniref:Magnesium transporter n=1 Tax=Plasmodium falciparum (isolate Dd2) TaxID=57267 RepID=A0A0L7M1X1_PLAF4|nr:hypothetical protein PFDG_02428 [Plasmodium falciparum Dd2]